MWAKRVSATRRAKTNGVTPTRLQSDRTAQRAKGEENQRSSAARARVSETSSEVRLASASSTAVPIAPPFLRQQNLYFLPLPQVQGE